MSKRDTVLVIEPPNELCFTGGNIEQFHSFITFNQPFPALRSLHQDCLQLHEVTEPIRQESLFQNKDHSSRKVTPSFYSGGNHPLTLIFLSAATFWSLAPGCWSPTLRSTLLWVYSPSSSTPTRRANTSSWCSPCSLQRTARTTRILWLVATIVGPGVIFVFAVEGRRSEQVDGKQIEVCVRPPARTEPPGG